MNNLVEDAAFWSTPRPFLLQTPQLDCFRSPLADLQIDGQLSSNIDPYEP